MSFWASFTGSVRNVGHRIGALFRRKKKRITKESEGMNNKLKRPDNAQIEKNFAASDLKTTNQLRLESKNKNLSEDSLTNQKFPKCSNIPKKDLNIAGETDSTAAHGSIKMLNEGSKNDEKVMDINQKYREMEIEVARRVRETMELADAKRKALYSSNTALKTDSIMRKTHNDKTYESVKIPVLGQIANIEQNLNMKTNPLQFEGPCTNDTNKADVKFLQSIGNISAETKAESNKIYIEPQDENLQAFKIDFENSFNAGMKQTDHAENYSIASSAMTDDSRFVEPDNAKQEVAEVPLSMSQNSRNTVNVPYEFIEGNQSELVDDAIDIISHGASQIEIGDGALYLAQQDVRNIDNIPSEGAITSKDIDLDTFALTDEIGEAKNWELLAKNGARNIDIMPYESVGLPQTETAAGALYLAQQGAKNIDTIPYERAIIAKDIDLDTFALTDEIGDAKNWELLARNIDIMPYESVGAPQTETAGGALYLAQQEARNFDNIPHERAITAKDIDLDTFALTDEIGDAKNAESALLLSHATNAINVDNAPFVDPYVERRELALNLSENAATNINTSINAAAINERLILGEGALQLAQNALRNREVISPEYPEDEDEQNIDTVNQQRPKLQIGFESFGRSFDDSMTDEDDELEGTLNL